MGHDHKVPERKIGWVLFEAFGISIFVIKRYLSPFIFDIFKDECISFFEIFKKISDILGDLKFLNICTPRKLSI